MKAIKFVELLQEFKSDDVPDLQTHTPKESQKMHEHKDCKKHTYSWPSRMKF